MDKWCLPYLSLAAEKYYKKRQKKCKIIQAQFFHATSQRNLW